MHGSAYSIGLDAVVIEFRYFVLADLRGGRPMCRCSPGKLRQPGVRHEAALAGGPRLCFHYVLWSARVGTPGKPGGKGRVMASIGDTSATKNAPDTKAVKNGPGTISDAVTVFEAD